MLEKGVWATGEIRAVGIATRTSRQGTDGAEVGGGHSTEEAGYSALCIVQRSERAQSRQMPVWHHLTLRIIIRATTVP
jgi:hypothetical protein